MTDTIRMGINPLLAMVNSGLSHAELEGEERGYIEGFLAGAEAQRRYIMQGDPTVPAGEHKNPYELAQQMQDQYDQRWNQED